MVLMICGAFGRILGGLLGDYIGPLPGYILMSLGQTIFVVWFPQASSVVGIYLLAAFFGFCNIRHVAIKYLGNTQKILFTDTRRQIRLSLPI